MVEEGVLLSYLAEKIGANEVELLASIAQRHKVLAPAGESQVVHPGELADREFCNPPLSALIARSNVAPARSRSADIPSSCINDEPPEQFDLSCCASPGPLPMLVFPLLPTALEPVRLDRF